MRIGRRQVLGSAGAALAFPAVHARAQAQGVALVIGNSKYHWEASLPNVKRDVPEVAKRLQALGLKTNLVQDVTRDAMQRAIDAFVSSSRGANLAAVYFAGHGAAWGKDTFLVPVDADLSDPSTVKTLLPVTSLRDGMEGASHRLMVYDNCRNNPADGWRQKEVADYSGNYVGNVNTGTPNTLALFSTAPGRVAVDGPPGDFSPFAAALMRQLDAPSVDLQALPAALRRDLLIATEGRQVLFDRNTYQAPFVLTGPPGRGPAAGRSSWAGDPSSIIELPNAYAFAQQSGLLLPSGLIAHRPGGKSGAGRIVGSYKTTDSFGGPAVMVILSAEDQAGAEIVMSLRERATGNSGWRFFHGTFSGKALEFVPSTKAPKIQLDWSDANSGRMTVMVSRAQGSSNKVSAGAPFTRLDG